MVKHVTFSSVLCGRVWIFVCWLVVSMCTTIVAEHRDDRQEEWVVRVEGGPRVASLLALQSGYKHLGPVLGFNDTYVWLKNVKFSQKKRGGLRLTKALNSSAKIIWAEQQKTIKRHKRDHIPFEDIKSERPLIREKRLEFSRYSINDIQNDKDWQEYWSHDPDDSKLMFDDELWDQEWYLQDTRSNKALPKLDLNVLPLYQLGVTGRGVRIAVLDDGLEYTHDDLRNNYDPYISYDVNEGDDDPLPRYELSGINGHGTRCAGEIAMEANNKKCGVGIAFEASIGGIKLLDGLVNDRVEGEALGYKSEVVDIYTASWGPADDGKSLEAPGRLAMEALERGITMGRSGKGSIYVWASGNGGSKSDDCGCDGYVSSIYTIAVGSASQTGRFPWYGESCPATLATTYSSGAYHDQMIATTDLRNTCTTRHTGTSASAPLAAGILALALQVNKDLTWRDVQHLIVWTSEYNPLRIDKRLAYGSVSRIRFEAGNECRSTGKKITFLEHVEIEVSLEYNLRGALQMHLTAPSGTTVQILKPRKLDDSTAGFEKWKFMSAASWGEDPYGSWTLDIMDEIGPRGNNGTMKAFALILHGTREMPEYRRNGPRIYNQEYNRIRKTNKLPPVDILTSSVFNKKNENFYSMLLKRYMYETRWPGKLSGI
ncbi:neuroendocrine convertase 1 isoform X2 [Calliopsis andreniformis]|uniref:neuroendocrine convertase 1 isoform X2 n=1 Tax=Calliopsis andreniformis TaxID=337506 RepID=UPI003FCD04A5